MPQLLLRTNAAVQDCERHLTDSGAFGTEIESYLTQYLLVILCADVQQEMYRLSEERALIANDAALSSFIAASSRKLLRSVRKSEIAGFIEMFGAGCKAKLDNQLDEAEISIYSNAVGLRHDVAHKFGSSISFLDLKKAVAIAEKLLTATANSLVVASLPSTTKTESHL
jgi:hypothetical protein